MTMPSSMDTTEHTTSHAGSWAEHTPVSTNHLRGNANQRNLEHEVLEPHPDIELVATKSSAEILAEHRSNANIQEGGDGEVLEWFGCGGKHNTGSMYVEGSLIGDPV